MNETLQRLEASQIGVGHVMLHLGVRHPIVTIAPHEAFEGWRTAYDNDGWSVALVPGQGWWVETTAASAEDAP